MSDYQSCVNEAKVKEVIGTIKNNGVLDTQSRYGFDIIARSLNDPRQPQNYAHRLIELQNDEPELFISTLKAIGVVEGISEIQDFADNCHNGLRNADITNWAFGLLKKYKLDKYINCNDDQVDASKRLLGRSAFNLSQKSIQRYSQVSLAKPYYGHVPFQDADKISPNLMNHIIMKHSKMPNEASDFKDLDELLEELNGLKEPQRLLYDQPIAPIQGVRAPRE